MDFSIHHAIFVSGIKIAGPIIVAQHKGHKRIGESRKRFRCAFGIKIAKLFCCTDRKWKPVQYKV
jgi:hypothetical protein